MKFLRKYRIAVVAALTIVMSSCGSGPIEHGTEYVLECPADADTADIYSTYLIIEKRLTNFGLEGDYELSRDANKINVHLRKGAAMDNSKMRRLLQSSAHLTFRAMYTFGEISSTFNEAQQMFLRLNNIDSLNPEGAGFSGLIAGVLDNWEGPMIFSCRAKDTSAVMSILRIDSIAMLFNSDVVFRWGTGIVLETGEPTYGLFACKTGYNYEMNGNYIQSASALRSSTTDAWEISLTFDPVGAKEFARITKLNVGRPLAIELDGFVYSYPFVNAEITGGMASISGVFTQTEAEDLASILSAGRLPVPVALLEEKEF